MRHRFRPKAGVVAVGFYTSKSYDRRDFTPFSKLVRRR